MKDVWFGLCRCRMPRRWFLSYHLHYDRLFFFFFLIFFSFFFFCIIVDNKCPINSRDWCCIYWHKQSLIGWYSSGTAAGWHTTCTTIMSQQRRSWLALPCHKTDNQSHNNNLSIAKTGQQSVIFRWNFIWLLQVDRIKNDQSLWSKGLI